MMPAIQITDLSKMYRLGVIGTGTLSHDLNRWWHKVRGKEDPYLKIGEENIQDGAKKSEYVWALKDINLEIDHGNVLGVIGKNGAGKSTLLKILSRVTGPTKGTIRYQGRIGSLLEVGTGFHPELTGKENIFLNGTILGMTKMEVRRKLDEIIDFSGCRLYIDTPVKRYSSGMKVRLAFSVAAHLEPEILVVDEVLAVGDAEFQKKAIGKMQDISRQDGRTVMFVSHNMTAVKSLCDSAVWLDDGKIRASGKTDEIVSAYLASSFANQPERTWDDQLSSPGNEFVRIRQLSLKAEQLTDQADQLIYIDEPIQISCIYENLVPGTILNLSMHVYNKDGVMVFNSWSDMQEFDAGKIMATCHIPPDLLNDEGYQVSVMIVKDGSVVLFTLPEALSFTVNERQRESLWHGKIRGVVRPKLVWDHKYLGKEG